jgi:hypothetical protein
VPQRPRLVLSQDNHLPGTIREPVKHLDGGYRRDDARLGQCSGMTPELALLLGPAPVNPHRAPIPGPMGLTGRPTRPQR